MDDKFAKKKTKKNKYTPKEHREVSDLARRMMGGGHVPGEITNPYALSYYMKGKGYEVKEKPSKPHARVKPFEKKKKGKKKKKAFEDGLRDRIVKLAFVVKIAEETGRKDFSKEEAKELFDKMDLGWKYDFDEFLKGLNIELEHGKVNPETDVTDDSSEETAKITMAHLNEIGDYNTRLQEMEDEANREK